MKNGQAYPGLCNDKITDVLPILFIMRFAPLFQFFNVWNCLMDDLTKTTTHLGLPLLIDGIDICSNLSIHPFSFSGRRTPSTQERWLSLRHWCGSDLEAGGAGHWGEHLRALVLRGAAMQGSSRRPSQAQGS